MRRTPARGTTSAGIGRRPEQSIGNDETRYKITEEFSNFGAGNGLFEENTFAG